jgi:hypothetical protein
MTVFTSACGRAAERFDVSSQKHLAATRADTSTDDHRDNLLRTRDRAHALDREGAID